MKKILRFTMTPSGVQPQETPPDPPPFEVPGQPPASPPPTPQELPQPDPAPPPLNAPEPHAHSPGRTVRFYRRRTQWLVRRNRQDWASK